MNLRYKIDIKFSEWTDYRYRYVKPLSENVKTLKEAQGYKDFIDDSVESATITDNISGKVIEILK